MSLLIQGGELITASSRSRADIYCEGETITRIAAHITPPPDCEVLPARGCLVFPGFVDPHVHVYLPTPSTTAKDTHETAGKAALLGGTTCYIEFVIPARTEEPRDALETWRAAAAGRSPADYSFHMAVTRYDASVAEQLEHIVSSEGITSFKVHLAYKDYLEVSDSELYHILGLARRLGAITIAHCENAAAVELLRRQLVSAGRRAPRWHYYSRPPEVEEEGTRHFLFFAALQQAPAYIAHLSSRAALAVAMQAVGKGQRVWIETLIQFLLLDKSYAELPDFEGAKYVMSPPLREKEDRSALWAALAAGNISTVGTDHAPFDFHGQKDLGRDDFTRIPNGLPGIEERVKLLYTHGVLGGRIDLHRFVDAASTRPARIFGLFPRKGTIQVGADADLVVWNPDWQGTISAATHHMNVDYSPYEGWKITGRAEYVTVRGRLMVEKGRFVGPVDHGRFIGRNPSG